MHTIQITKAAAHARRAIAAVSAPIAAFRALPQLSRAFRAERAGGGRPLSLRCALGLESRGDDDGLVGGGGASGRVRGLGMLLCGLCGAALVWGREGAEGGAGVLWVGKGEEVLIFFVVVVGFGAGAGRAEGVRVGFCDGAAGGEAWGSFEELGFG